MALPQPLPELPAGAPAPAAAAPVRAPAGFDPAGLPTRVSQAVWRGNELGQLSQTAVSTGFPALDAELPGGGWPCNNLTEILLPQPSLCEWRLVAPSLRPLAVAGGQVLMVAPPKRPNLPGLASLGLKDKNLVWVAADTPAERLWTTEQLIKANPDGAILAWLPKVRSEQLRRLQVQAASCDCPVFIFRDELAQRDSSPAPLRLLATLGQDWNLEVNILKRRGGTVAHPIQIQSIPGDLARVLQPRLLRPSQATTSETSIALGSIAEYRRLRRTSLQ